jgi:protease-4
MRPRRRRLAWPAALAGAIAAMVSPARAVANPNEGEARSILRDADRVYTTVAGEGDGASTVVNPANLGFLRGVNGILDVAWTARSARRRGSGVGAFIGIPLPWQIAALGFGYQYLYPVQLGGGTDASQPEPQQPDNPFSKLSFALSVPLQRWVRGLSVGVTYSRLVSSTNFHAKGINQVDVGISYWPMRFLAIGLVGRGLNVPATGLLEDCQPSGSVSGCVVQPLEVDPELAVRPLGTPALELAAGARIAPLVPADVRFQPWHVTPRGRVSTSVRGVKVFAEAERWKFLPVGGGGADLTPRDAVKVTGGIEVNFGHVGLAAGPILGGNGADPFAAEGGVGRLRISQERYTPVAVSPRLVTRLQLSSFSGERGMWRAVQEIDAVAERGGVVLLETRGVSLGYAQLEEVREAVLRLRARGGKAITFMEGGGLRAYFLASASDRILANPEMSLDLLGMRIQAFYWAELLAKLGAKAEFVRIAEYKGTPEVYERSTATEPVARQRKMLVSDAWNHVLRLVARERGHDPRVVKEWIDEAPIFPPRALTLGIIDELAYPDELDERIETWLARKVRIEKPSETREHTEVYGALPRVAVLFIEGDLVAGDSFTIPILGRRIAGSRTLTKQIEKLRKDPSVRAVVVRIDSPGGVVSAADAIARELDLTRKEKPVVISMSNACASGGYYIATAGQFIFADATTVTGSIGIFYPKMDLSGTLEMFGVGVDEFDFGKHAGMRSWWKPYTESEREAALRDITSSYEVFTGRVARARSMTLPQVDEVARGRVWSGVRGTEVGLVDAYGGLREAVMRARSIAGMRVDQGTVQLYPEPPSLLENVRAVLGFRLPGSFGDAERVGAGGFGAAGAAASGGALAWLPRPILLVLSRLPVALWHGDSPEALALSERTWVIE